MAKRSSRSSQSARASSSTSTSLSPSPVSPSSSSADSGSSTHSMLRHLAISPATDPLFITTLLLLAETVPARIVKLKNDIIALYKTTNASLLTPFNDTTVLHTLLNYYQQTKVNDRLYQLLFKFNQTRKCKSVCEQLLQQRGHEISNIQFSVLQKELPPEHAHFNDVMNITVICNNLSEAALMMTMLETVLYENYDIPYRAAIKFLPVDFEKYNGTDGKIEATIHFTPSDYQKIMGPLRLSVKDKVLEKVFLDPKSDLYTYCQAKYESFNTREFIFSPATLAAIDLSTLDTSSPEQIRHFSGRILLVTRTGLGSGNYINARLTIEGLCRLMPLVSIDWVIANDGDPLPTVKKLPHQVRLYETDALWKLYPLIRALSIDADVVASLPNNFLVGAEQQLLNTPLTLSEKSVFMMVNEYNSTYAPEDVPPYYLNLRSGIDTSMGSTGIIIPEALELPSSLAKKRSLICQNEKAAQIFLTHPEAPLYFAYVYHPKTGVMHSSVKGINIIDVLALFIQHAKQSKHTHIKVLLPIEQSTIDEAMRVYPAIFNQCTLYYTHSTGNTKSGDGLGICVEVFHLFPYDNKVFRQFMDYAAAHHTPVITTGDQSFMELFFTITNGFIFLYQLLEHKKNLLDQIKLITTHNNMPHLNYLFTHTEKGLASEHELMSLTAFLITNQDVLKQESLQLSAIIKAQPNLIDSLARIIVESVTKKRLMMETANDLALEDLDEGKKRAASF